MRGRWRAPVRAMPGRISKLPACGMRATPSGRRAMYGLFPTTRERLQRSRTSRRGKSRTLRADGGLIAAGFALRAREDSRLKYFNLSLQLQCFTTYRFPKI
jgi:hypothetical protein